MSDGTRTRGRRDHNPELYQLSYAHQADCVANLAARRAPQKAPGRWTGGRFQQRAVQHPSESAIP